MIPSWVWFLLVLAALLVVLTLTGHPVHVG